MLYLIQYLFCMLVLGRKPHRHVYGPWFVEYVGNDGYKNNHDNWSHYSRVVVRRICPCGACQEKRYLTSDHISEASSNKAGEYLKEQVMLALNTSAK